MKDPKSTIDIAEQFARELGIPESVLSRADLERAAQSPDIDVMVETFGRSKAAKEVSDCMHQDTMTVVATSLDAAELVHCVPANPGDWNSVHRMMSTITLSFISAALHIFKLQKEHANRAKHGVPDTLEHLSDLTTQIAMFTGMHLILKSHATLVLEHAVLETRNADIHYDRLKGMCEERVANKKEGK